MRRRTELNPTAPEEHTMARRYINLLAPVALAIGVALFPTTARALDTADTRLLSTPAITEGKIAFVYADDIWVAGSDGSNPRRLTSHPGEERNPYFAPDGKHIAFSASYDGNVDVYVIPTEGGEPSRLTWHPGEDVVRGFTPDGKVLFSSQRAVFTRRHAQFFTLGVTGGVPQTVPVPTADMGAISPDGKYLAYTPLAEAWRQWKNYRGGTTSRIWILKLDDLSHEEVAKPADGCNDTQPMWIGDTVYFLSDRDGEFNLYSFDRDSKKVARHTDHDAFPIASASSGAGKVIYEQAGWVHLFDPGAGKSRRLEIGVAADLTEPRPRYATGATHVRNFGISPSGKRAVLEYRGEIVTVPVKKGDPRNLTRTPGAHERSPVWSPDGKSIAYFSDASGEYALVVRPQDGKGEGRSYPLKGAGFYERPVWSPDSGKIAFIDNARTIYWINLGSGAVTRVAAEPIYGPINTLSCAWSPDSKWLAYTLTNRAGFQTIRLYALGPDQSHPLTDGLIEAFAPVFDSSGKYLYFLASTDAGPVKNWFDQSNTDMRANASVYLVTLASATPNPLLRESDEETAAEAAKDKKTQDSKTKSEKASKDREKGPDKDKDQAKSPTAQDKPAVVIDLEGIAGRVVPLPIESGHLENLAAGNEGQVYYIRRAGGVPLRGRTGRGSPSLKRFDLKTREEETLAEGIESFSLSTDRKKVLYQVAGPGGDGQPGEPPEGPVVLGIVNAGKFTKGDGALKLETVSVPVEPRAEWGQIFREAWRINRDYFYAPNMHGADWNAVRMKYEELLPHLASRGDLNRVIRMMLSELSVGHSFSGGGERLYEPKPIPVGLLGADYEVANGRYRFKTIYGGAYWDPSLRTPLSAPGVDIKPGEFLLAVDGKEIKTESEVYRYFEATVGKRVELRVGPKSDGSGARTVIVEPIADESGLRNRAWVEGNLRKVHERTKGRVAYVYVPNTAEMGYVYFKRYFFPQADKEAIIVDERFNGGGQVADYYIEMLRRPLVSHWATRYGEPIRTPNAVILGPKVMIIDETAGSGGDLLPWMFHKFGLGKLVGRRTWGGLVGILGFPILMDGGRVTAPDLAIFTEQGWVVENVGVSPDIEVEQDPAAVAAGKDPQLDRAIDVALEELAKNPPPQAPTRPPFPVRVRPSASGNPAAAGAAR
ncbi:MAG: PDZ domain-containing protein [Isosphaerales bacterium]